MGKKWIAIDPIDGTVVAPVAGEITLVFQLEMLSVCVLENGAEIPIHVSMIQCHLLVKASTQLFS